MRTDNSLYNQIYERCFNNSLVASAIMDKSYNFVRVNDAYAQLDEREADYFIGKNHFDLYPSDAIDFFEGVVQTKEAYQAFARPFKYRSNPERGITYWDLTLEPILSEDGEIELLVLSLMNVTERVNMEKELSWIDRLNLIGQTAGGIGHEIRNPLTTVRGYLQLLAQKELYEEDKSYFEIMISELDRANAIITQFLSLSKKEVDDMSCYDLNEIIMLILPLLEAQALCIGVDIVLNLKPVSQIMANEKEIRQVIINLINNALEVSNKQQVITVNTMQNGEYCVLEVIDQGPGIDESIRSKLGTPFFSTKDNGTGLGLSICYSIINRHNGKIDFESGDNGCKFIVSLPSKVTA